MRDFEMRGAAQRLLTYRGPEVCAAGAAGTGKSVAMLLKLHITSALVPNCTSIILRQTHSSLTASTLRTFEEHIAVDAIARGEVRWYGGSGSKPAGYRYPNGSIIMAGGLDQPGKFLSMDLDRIAIDEANQVSVVAYETLLTRLRGRADTYKQIVLSTNPDHPDHWIRKRADTRALEMLTSVHTDNPYLFDRDGQPTEAGKDYLDKLNALTGVRRARYLEGRWVAREGLVFDDWRDADNVIEPFDIPKSWPLFLSVDFGFSNPFVCQWWRIDPDGRMYLTREIHQTQVLVEDHARRIKGIIEEHRETEPTPFAVVCDHDAEDRATLTRHLGLPTVAAKKAVSRGVQLTQSRLRKAGDGRPRLYVLSDALIGRDLVSDAQARPRGFLAEVTGYVWAVERGTDGIPKEVPVKLNDHSCFVRGTLVETEAGPVPIEHVTPGTRVRTRNGLRPVLASGITSNNAKVLSVQLSSGATLTGTGNHPVWVDGSGWVRMDALRYGDTLAAWQKASEKCSTGSSTVDTPRHTAHPTSGTTSPVSQTGARVPATFTGMSGPTTTDQCLTGTTYTMSTSTQTTTTFPTWSHSPGLNTLLCTAPGTPHCTHPRNVSNTSNESSPSPKSGMPLMKAESGTDSMQPTKGSGRGNRTTGTATNVAAPSLPFGCLPTRPEMTSVVTSASQLGGVLQVSTTSNAHALTAAVSSPSTATAGPGTVPVRVLMLTDVPGTHEVYNLTVEDAPEYFASGVLVHNCDAARYAVAHLDWNEAAKLGNPARAGEASQRSGSAWARPVGR